MAKHFKWLCDKIPSMEIDATFSYMKRKDVEHESTPDYREYRRRWADFPKKHIVERVPIHLDLESTSACNLRCVMCFQSFNPPKPGFMDMDLFRKIVDEGAEKGVCSLKLQYRGEPLLHPEIDEMVRYAKGKGILEVMFNTNANLLTPDMSRRLIDAGLDKLICSVDGCTKKEYERVRVRGDFYAVVSNIRAMQDIKKELGSQKPVVRVQMVDMGHDDMAKKSYLDYWGHIADHVAIEKMNDFTDKDGRFTLRSKAFDCPMPYQRLIVLHDGTVTICCGNIYGKLTAGNLKDSSLEEIWNGPVISRLRGLNASGDSHKARICAECGYRGTVICEKGLDCERIENVDYEL